MQATVGLEPPGSPQRPGPGPGGRPRLRGWSQEPRSKDRSLQTKPACPPPSGTPVCGTGISGCLSRPAPQQSSGEGTEGAPGAAQPLPEARSGILEKGCVHSRKAGTPSVRATTPPSKERPLPGSEAGTRALVARSPRVVTPSSESWGHPHRADPHMAAPRGRECKSCQNSSTKAPATKQEAPAAGSNRGGAEG